MRCAFGSTMPVPWRRPRRTLGAITTERQFELLDEIRFVGVLDEIRNLIDDASVEGAPREELARARDRYDELTSGLDRLLERSGEIEEEDVPAWLEEAARLEHEALALRDALHAGLREVGATRQVKVGLWVVGAGVLTAGAVVWLRSRR